MALMYPPTASPENGSPETGYPSSPNVSTHAFGNGFPISSEKDAWIGPLNFADVSSSMYARDRCSTTATGGLLRVQDFWK